MSVRLMILPLALALACGDTTGPAAGKGRVSLAIAARIASTQRGAALAPGTLELGGTTLVLEQVELVLREIELERIESTEDCDNDAPGTSSDDCEELAFGPLLVNLPPGGGSERVVSVDVAPGVYDEVEFELHKPEDDARDRAFVLANPEFARISLRVRGTFNGTPFVFTSDLNADQEFDLIPPLTVTEGGVVDLTFRVDLSAWFVNRARTAFVDPATANKGGPNEGLVKDNIRDSFEALGND